MINKRRGTHATLQGTTTRDLHLGRREDELRPLALLFQHACVAYDTVICTVCIRRDVSELGTRTVSPYKVQPRTPLTRHNATARAQGQATLAYSKPQRAVHGPRCAGGAVPHQASNVRRPDEIGDG